MRDQHAAAGVITVQRRRVLWVFPSTRIEVADPAAVRVVREPLIGGADPAAVPIEDAALAVLAMDGHVARTATSVNDDAPSRWGHPPN